MNKKKQKRTEANEKRILCIRPYHKFSKIDFPNSFGLKIQGDQNQRCNAFAEMHAAQ